MSTLLPNYDRTRFFANLRSQGYHLTAEEETRTDALIRSKSADGGIWPMIRQALFSGWQFIQNLFAGSNDNRSMSDRMSAALDTGTRLGGQRELNELMHGLRDSLREMGGNIALAASAITGDTSGGQPVMPGNLRDIGLTTTPHTPADLQRGTRLDPGETGPQPARYAVQDTTEIMPPPAKGATRTLTSPAPGA